MKHFIFTRFNLTHPTIGRCVYNNTEWMNHRCQLFEKYTLPGIRQQTCKDFTVLLAFDEKTPEKYINKYKNEPNIKIIYEYPPDWLKKQGLKGDVLTSRLDNDDYYMPEFVELVQKECTRKPLLIDVQGVQLDRKTGKFYDNGRVSNNSPFISLYEDAKDMKTVFFCSHTKMEWHFESVKVPKVLSCMVIHERNVCNKIVGSEL